MKHKKFVLVAATISGLVAMTTSFAEKEHDPEHNDGEHEKAERNLDHDHWEKAHGSGVPDRNVSREPALPEPEPEPEGGR